MDIAFAIMFFLAGALTNEVWRSILNVGFTARVCKDTVYQTFKVGKTFTDHIEVILAYQYKTMQNAGIPQSEIEEIVEINTSALSMWKRAFFDVIMAEVPILIKDHFKQEGYTSLESVFEKRKS